MATLDDVAAIALKLPEVAEGDRHGRRTWAVAGKVFAWSSQSRTSTGTPRF